MASFSHSGSTGDIISSLAVVNALGGNADYYLRLNNMDAVAQSIGWPGAGRHSGRMTQEDFDALAPLMRVQPGIKNFEVYTDQKIDYALEEQAKHHNPPGWPRSFSRQYAATVGLDIEKHHAQLDVIPFLFADTLYKIPGRNVMIGSNQWYMDGIPNPKTQEWETWIDSGIHEQAFYCGLKSEYEWFKNTFQIDIPHVQTENLLDLARLMMGCELVIANQSLIGTMAVSMGKSCWIQTRKNTDLMNNEIYYPYKITSNYF